jgi:hypothetical protein
LPDMVEEHLLFGRLCWFLGFATRFVAHD